MGDNISVVNSRRTKINSKSGNRISALFQKNRETIAVSLIVSIIGSVVANLLFRLL